MRTYPRLRGQHWNLWPILKPDDGGDDVFFHVTALRDGDEIAKEKTVAIWDEGGTLLASRDWFVAPVLTERAGVAAPPMPRFL